MQLHAEVQAKPTSQWDTSDLHPRERWLWSSGALAGLGSSEQDGTTEHTVPLRHVRCGLQRGVHDAYQPRLNSLL